MSQASLMRARYRAQLDSKIERLASAHPNLIPLELALRDHPEERPAAPFPAHLAGSLVGEKGFAERLRLLEVRRVFERTCAVEIDGTRRLARRVELLIAPGLELSWEPGTPAEFFYALEATTPQQRAHQRRLAISRSRSSSTG